MRKFGSAERVRDAVLSNAVLSHAVWSNSARSYRDRYGRRARALAERLEGDDDEVVIRPWEMRLPRLVILAAARARGFEPVGGVDALVDRGPWTQPMRFARSAAARPTSLRPTAARPTSAGER